MRRTSHFVCALHTFGNAMSKGGRTKSKCNAGGDKPKYFLLRICPSIRPNTNAQVRIPLLRTTLNSEFKKWAEYLLYGDVNQT